LVPKKIFELATALNSSFAHPLDQWFSTFSHQRPGKKTQ